MHRAPTLEGLPSEKTIESVVHAFYAKIRSDALLGPIFGARLDGRWDAHLQTMVDFWSSILRTSGRYSGRPLKVHGELGFIPDKMWSRWLQLFRETAAEHASPVHAELFSQRAEQIANHLSRTLATQHSANP